MKQHFLVLLLILLYITNISAQKHDYVWTLGYGTKLPNGGTNINFNFNPPDTDYIKRNVDFTFSCASICDYDGRLLFYTNGCNIYNAKNQVIKNGNKLSPSSVTNDYCSEIGNLPDQGSLFLPHPADTNLYYLFHLRPNSIDEKDFVRIVIDTIYYSLIDKRLNNQQGEVIIKNKALLGDTSFTIGKMTAVKHGNGRDWWIIQPFIGQHRFAKFLLTPKGIEGPIVQTLNGTVLNDWMTGRATFSPDGSKYVSFDRHNDLNIYDFDRCSGILSKHQKILLPNARDSIKYNPNSTLKFPVYSAGGVAVSPNSKWLYVTTQPEIFQYDLGAEDVAASVNSVAILDTFFYMGLPARFSAAHIAPDGKIYITNTNSLPNLHVINEPDNRNCNITQNSFVLTTLNAGAFPNFPNFRLGALKNSICDTIKTSATSNNAANTYGQIEIFPNPSQQEINIHYDLPTDAIWLLYNSTGQLIFQKPLYHTETMTNIDTNALSNGIYFWKVISNGNIIQRGKQIILK